jgi:hypothetical protein
MKKIIFILSLFLCGELFGQSECYDPYPIILRHPIEPLQVPLSNYQNYTVLGYTLKIEGYPTFEVKGNQVMTKYIKEYLDKKCHVYSIGEGQSQCYVLMKELVVRRNDDGQIFTLGGDKYLYAFWYPIVN